ncbi:FepA family TonB-dependent siderophore receptor [Lonepinella koalarum]|uniref:Ferric enterobactin receptor n=1 Tax=Lonepinella koalarum TaxID=53417 RepID=A0A4R1KTD1_9PAST|nr:FepA family TonB-dependent siderophore receptor [Lonepinella koalarum]MDH2927504.1 outer membrane receptor protein [Lonepinella koalarum]TCK68354.1 ferric enterobactin receptor [Lonepinella koalarum]TFJ89610.1 TonB-dependent siderophore receptor [Lonepinella koalarum]
MKKKQTKFKFTCKLSLVSLSVLSSFAMAEESLQNVEELETIHVTAEQQLQQSLGVSQISKKDLEKRPVANDVSELLRTMPGVNLTGNSSTSQRGNKRQIDIRGMGPENTLILIDGKPVTSRNSERMGRRGERNTRGDSNWVPPEQIESITVLRGPAAARYGSGAMGGVVNIKTKPVSNELKGSVTYYTNQPRDDAEGSTTRVGFDLSGPVIKDVLAFRLYGSANKTKPDAVNINEEASSSNVAGVEGVRNRDIAGRLEWKMDPRQTLILDSSFSRQGNIYNGDTQLSNAALSSGLIRENGMETARLYRSAYSLTHKGEWDWGNTENTISYERTKNSRLPEGLTGYSEGAYTSTSDFSDSRLTNFRLQSEANIPFTLGVSQVLTVGAEYNHAKLDDPQSMTQQYLVPVSGFDIGANRSGEKSQSNVAVFAEDNIYVTERTIVIPSLRFDYNTDSGSNWSPALNISHELNDMFTIKGGIARAYKAPNLYQVNPNYLLYSTGAGCPLPSAANGYTVYNTSCYILGNENLKPETSVNKEIGLEFEHNGWQASITYFHNAYRNKIVTGAQAIWSNGDGGQGHVFQWENTPKATIEGFEGNLVIPLSDNLTWSNNFSYMRKSEDYQGNPLSIIPKHTINSTLAYQATDKLDMNLTFTHYGRQKPRTVAIIKNETLSATALTYDEIGSYGVLGINAGYQFNKHFSGRIGMTNILNKKLYRTNNGAQSYNEHGRSIYMTAKLSF